MKIWSTLKGVLPLRKIDTNRVSLTSYYGKTFINRGRRKAADYGVWLTNSVMSKALDKEDNEITDLFTANVFDSKFNAPRAYTALSMSFSSFKCRKYTLVFDRSILEDKVGKDILNYASNTAEELIVIGYSNNSNLFMDKNNAIYELKDNKLEFLSTVENFLGLDGRLAPVEYAEMVVGGKDIPIGVVLAYYLGFSKLLKLLKVTPRIVEAGRRVNLEANEYSLTFSDETLIFNREDKLASLILGGFNEYHKSIRNFNTHSFDKKGVYLNLLEANKLTVRHIRELDLMNKLFVDPITKEILIEMKEPTTLQGLLVRACELLLKDYHPDEMDTKEMRIKAYERIPGAIYRQLVGAVRMHGSQIGKNNKKIELNPYAVWKHVTEDPTKIQTVEINPLQALKESEAVTFSGAGGRSSRSMVKHTRGYSRNSMGTISESTVDSTDVGINVFLSANPQFTSLRGISRDFNFEEQGTASLFSTSTNLAPISDRDDQQ